MKRIFEQSKLSTTSCDRISKSNWRFGQSGQVVIEYVLLLVVGIAIAAIITSTMVSRDENNPGFLVAKWRQILILIGEDTADDIKDAQ